LPTPESFFAIASADLVTLPCASERPLASWVESALISTNASPNLILAHRLLVIRWSFYACFFSPLH
jgi:hypothetical protein